MFFCAMGRAVSQLLGNGKDTGLRPDFLADLSTAVAPCMWGPARFQKYFNLATHPTPQSRVTPFYPGMCTQPWPRPEPM